MSNISPPTENLIRIMNLMLLLSHPITAWVSCKVIITPTFEADKNLLAEVRF